MMQVVKAGYPFYHRGISLHKRLPATGEPPTYWLTLTMPWKQWLYDLTIDDMRYKHPHWSFGFRFWRS